MDRGVIPRRNWLTPCKTPENVGGRYNPVVNASKIRECVSTDRHLT